MSQQPAPADFPTIDAVINEIEATEAHQQLRKAMVGGMRAHLQLAAAVAWQQQTARITTDLAASLAIGMPGEIAAEILTAVDAEGRRLLALLEQPATSEEA
jgi:hypothetical protein